MIKILGLIVTCSIFLKNFKNGSFRLALENKINIVPLTHVNNKSHFPQEYYKGYPGLVRITVHKPVNPNSFSEQIIPSDISPQIFDFLISKVEPFSKGNFVPGVAKNIFCPSSIFGAPQTT